MKILNGSHVGIQSYSLRNLDGNESIIKALKLCGIDRLEACDLHVKVGEFSNEDEVLRLYRENGIEISSYGINHFPNDESKLRPFFSFAQKAGFSTLGIYPEPDAFQLIEELCEEYSIKVAIHNHGRDHRYGRISQLKDILGKTSDNIGVCLDTGWMLDAGENPVEAAETFAGRLYGVHFKDFSFSADNQPIEAVLGSGELNLDEFMSKLQEIDFKGYCTIEYEIEENPVPGIIKCVDALRNIR